LPKFVEELRSQPIQSFVSGLVEAPPDSNLSKIIGLLGERGVYEVFLPEGTKCGMLSARDVLKNVNFETTKPSALMSYVPVLSKGVSIGEVARIMADYRIRAVPITDGRKIIGQVNCIGLLHQLKGKLSGDMRITSIATKDPITIDAEAPIAKAKELMVRKRIDHLPVNRDRRLAGILTSGQIASRISPPERVGSKSVRPETRGSLDFPAHEAMEPNPLTCPPEAAAEYALESMLSGGRTYILVSQWDELQGIATYRDFMTLLAEREPETEVPIFMVGLPDDPFEAEATKTKFKRTVNQLHRIFPDILEARSVIKAKFTKPGKERGRYEVSVAIRTPRNSYTYSDGGWELPAVYDVITDRLKRLMTQKQKRRRVRERERPGTI
jgi:CBS domain-containing protein